MERGLIIKFLYAHPARFTCILLISLLALASCSEEPKAPDSFLKFYDKESLISQATKNILVHSLKVQNTSSINNIVIATASKVDPRQLTLEADKAAARINQEQFWLWRFFWPRNSNTVTLFYSESPVLLQIRYGRSLRLKAKIAGINSGLKYAQFQQLKSTDGSYNFQAIAQRIQTTISKIKTPTYKSFAYLFITVLDDELVPLTVIPHFELWDGMSSIAALPLYNAMIHLSPNYVAFTIMLIGCIVAVFALVMLVAARFGTKYKRPDGGIQYQATSGVGCLVYLGCFLVLLIVVYPMLGFLSISAHSRAEDLLMSQAIGLERTFSVPEQIHWGWILLLLLATWAGKYVPLALAPKVEDWDLFKSLLNSFLVTPVAFFILPAWVVIFYACTAVSVGIFSYTVLLRRGHPPAEAEKG